MVGAVIFTHGELGHGLLDALSSITGEQDSLIVISIEGDSVMDDGQAMVSEAIGKVDSGDGVIIFTDMLGGTPSNLALPFLNNDKIEIFMGVNLPLLIKFVSKRATEKFNPLVTKLKASLKDSIVAASDILESES